MWGEKSWLRNEATSKNYRRRPNITRRPAKITEVHGRPLNDFNYEYFEDLHDSTQTSEYFRRCQEDFRSLKKQWNAIEIKTYSYQGSKPALLAMNVPTGNWDQRICVGFLEWNYEETKQMVRVRIISPLQCVLLTLEVIPLKIFCSDM